MDVFISCRRLFHHDFNKLHGSGARQRTLPQTLGPILHSGNCRHPVWEGWGVKGQSQQAQQVCARQEKEVLAKGGFWRIQSLTQGNKKYPWMLGPAVQFSTQSTTAKRGLRFCKNPLLKTPLFFVPDPWRPRMTSAAASLSSRSAPATAAGSRQLTISPCSTPQPASQSTRWANT